MVNLEIIKAAITDREKELTEKLSQEKIISRENTVEIKQLLSTDVALVITGIRRCGKSMLAFMLGADHNFAYINFEDERLSLEAGELNKVLEAVYSLKGEKIDLLIFDEIQNIIGWEKFISRLITNKKIIITGSNARLLSKELSTYLTGRHIDFNLFPFSFREFLQYKGFHSDIYSTPDQTVIKEYFKEYCEKGGFPLSSRLGNIFLSENYKDIIERDIVQRYKIKYLQVLKELAKYLISNLGQEISFNQLKNIFHVKSVHTIKNYSLYLQNIYLIFFLERFSFKLKEQNLAPKKIYCLDTGLANVVGFKFSEQKGHLFENIAAIELLRSLNLKRNTELYYWKDHQQREVDFVLKEEQKIKQLIQVTAISSKNELNKRELTSLITASKELNCPNLLVLTEDYEQEEIIKDKTIQFLPLWKWLIKNRDN